MARISDSLRQQVTQRAGGLCEYCQSAQIVIAYMTVDHIQPESAGGQTILINLCSCCIACNTFKSDFVTGLDPQSGREIPLFNPRTQIWDEHFEWSADGTQVIGLTEVGRATVNRLRMNRDEVVNARRLWVQSGWHPPQSGRFPLE